MNTRRLEAFLAIVRCGSFASASEQLNMTQSAISLRIRELESELGIEIFDRSRRKAVLTAEGRSLVPYAMAVIAAVNDLRYALGSEASVSGSVRLGVTELVAVTWLPRLVHALQQRFPRLQLQLKVGLANHLVEQTLSGMIDIALTPGTRFEAELESVALGAVAFQWVAAPSLLGPKWSWDLSAPNSPPVLLFAEDSFINSVADAWFRQHGITPRRIDTCNSMNVLAALTAAGLGISLLPTFCYSAELEQGSLQLVDPESSIKGTFFAVFRRNSLTATARIVAAISREVSTFPQPEQQTDEVNDLKN